MIDDKMSKEALLWLANFVPYFLNLNETQKEIIHFSLKYEIPPDKLYEFIWMIRRVHLKLIIGESNYENLRN